MPLVSLFSKITFTSDVLTAADPFSRGRFDPRSPGSPRALTYYRDPPCLYNYYLRWSSKIRLNNDRWRVRHPDRHSSLLKYHLGNVEQVGRFEIIAISLGQLVLQHPRTALSPIIPVPFVSGAAECFVSDVLRAEFLQREKERLFIAKYRGGEFLEGCLFHDKWNSLAMPATIGPREPGSLKMRVCRLQLSGLSSLVLWHLSLHTFIPQTKVTKSPDSRRRPPQRPFVKRGDMRAGKGVTFGVSLASVSLYQERLCH